MTYQFYECDNPACKLRFPGSEEHPRWHRCPICRSTLHMVAAAQNAAELDRLPLAQYKPAMSGLLDNVRSAWNVGSIFRTADGLGIDKLCLCGITPSPDNTKVRKTALGAESSVQWERSNNGVLLATQLKSSGYQVWALEDIPGALPLFSIGYEPSNAPVVLVVGNEISGIDPGILEVCDRVIAIPMAGRKRSFNVAVAFGMAAGFLLYRQSVSQGSRSTLPRT